MSTAAIKVETLSKAYRIGLEEQIPDTIVGAVADWLKAPLRNLRRLRRLNTFEEATSGESLAASHSPSSISSPSHSPLASSHSSSLSDTIWALRDVSFEVQPGEVVGIIGRNGAGKSTLLKILSRITDPTSGRAEINGRVASLLEVGTGFHPELTGRENVYMNGTILGMTKREIDAKFDEIVDFSGVDKFLDTPIKRYSSGMQVRLAFSVAAHLEPEILVIDEVLAVGDAAFQKKCLGKMSEVSDSGRTVLFVSHNMGAVNRLCQRAIALDEGEVLSDGPTAEVVKSHLKRCLPNNIGNIVRMPEQSELSFQITSIAVMNSQGKPIQAIGIWEEAGLEIEFRVREPLTGSNLSITVSRDGFPIFNSFDTDLSPESSQSRPAGSYRATVTLPSGLLAPGTYTVSVSTGFTSVAALDRHLDAVSFEVTADEEDLLHKSYSRDAAVVARIPWNIKEISGVRNSTIQIEASPLT